ncbi:MAG: hypothetical protein J6Y20_04550 [Lachnospiraceae bacterium]|nr:hypothetical protein [Kiritimatiellia bacterium]MBP5461375.1 hypothetical protein [Lachnospiraceae bacterium]
MMYYTLIAPLNLVERLQEAGCFNGRVAPSPTTYADLFDALIDVGLSIEISRSQTMDGWSVIITEIETKVWRVIGHWEKWSDAADKALIYAIKLLKNWQK